MMKQKQEQLVLVFHQYRDACEKAGISGSLNFTRQAKTDMINSKSNKSVMVKRNKAERLYKNKKDQKIDLEEPREVHSPTFYSLTSQPNEANYKALWTEIQQLKKQKQASEEEIRTE